MDDKPPSDLPEDNAGRFDKKYVILHWSIMLILWLLFIFEIWLIVTMLQWWADSTYLTSAFIVKGKIIEIIAFALSIVMALYTIGITILTIVNIFRSTIKKTQYKSFVRLNGLVLTAFFVHWGIFILTVFILNVS